jgi:hypothetical protein
VPIVYGRVRFSGRELVPQLYFSTTRRHVRVDKIPDIGLYALSSSYTAKRKSIARVVVVVDDAFQ